MMKLVSKMAILTAARLLGAGSVFLITFFLARFYGADVVANYSLLLSAASILSVLLPVGFHAIATLFAAEYKAVGQHRELEVFIKYAHKLTLINALIALPAAIGLAYFVPFSADYHVLYLALLAVPTAFFMANIYTNSALLIGVEHHYWAHLPDMILRPVLILAGLMLLFFSNIAERETVLLLVLLAAGITMLVQWVAMRRILPAGSNDSVADETLHKERKRWWFLALNHMKITLLWDYFFEIHLLIAGFLFAPGQVAILFICFRIRQLAGFGMRSIYSLLMPKVMAANALKETGKTQELLGSSVRLACAYAVLVWLVITVIGPYVLQAFGDEYVNAQPVLLIMLGTMVVRGIFGPASIVLGMQRHADVVVRILVISLVISLAITFIGAIQFPALAIPIAYFISTTFSAIAIWWIAKQRTALNSAVWA